MIKKLFSTKSSNIFGESYFEPQEEEKDRIKICKLMDELKIMEKKSTYNFSNGYDIELCSKLSSFIQCFSESGLYSIDSYLAKYIEIENDKPQKDEIFPKIGKLIIAYLLSKIEKNTPIGFQNFNWIHHLINKFLKNEELLDKFLDKPPKIFTFNYDNFLENTFLKHFQRFHDKNYEEALNMVKKIEIKHIYGHINSYIDEKKTIEKICENALDLNGVDSIRVIGEDRNHKKIEVIENISVEIGAAIWGSKKVYFLGYGFDDLNNAIIFKHIASNMYTDMTFKNEKKMQGIPDADFFSTNYKMKRHQIYSIRSKIKDNYKIDINFHHDNNQSEGFVDCEKLIEELAPIFE